MLHALQRVLMTFTVASAAVASNWGFSAEPADSERLPRQQYNRMVFIRTAGQDDLATKNREKLGAGFYRAQWASDGKSVVSNGLAMGKMGTERLPARFWLDRSKTEFFLTDRDNPFSPCVSRDGKTVVIIVDSKERKREF